MILTIFYDGQCPLCMAEMRQLKHHDRQGNILFVNLHSENLIEEYPHIDPVKANQILHGQLDSGELLLGLDVTCKAWQLVGKHTWLKILRWPVVRILSDAIYLLFARYRNKISYIVTGTAPCTSCSIDKS